MQRPKPDGTVQVVDHYWCFRDKTRACPAVTIQWDAKKGYGVFAATELKAGTMLPYHGVFGQFSKGNSRTKAMNATKENRKKVVLPRSDGTALDSTNSHSYTVLIVDVHGDEGTYGTFLEDKVEHNADNRRIYTYLVDTPFGKDESGRRKMLEPHFGAYIASRVNEMSEEPLYAIWNVGVQLKNYPQGFTLEDYKVFEEHMATHGGYLEDLYDQKNPLVISVRAESSRTEGGFSGFRNQEGEFVDAPNFQSVKEFKKALVKRLVALNRSSQTNAEKTVEKLLASNKKPDIREEDFLPNAVLQETCHEIREADQKTNRSAMFAHPPIAYVMLIKDVRANEEINCCYGYGDRDARTRHDGKEGHSSWKCGQICYYFTMAELFKRDGFLDTVWKRQN